jgi:hypothetical protein
LLDGVIALEPPFERIEEEQEPMKDPTP